MKHLLAFLPITILLSITLSHPAYADTNCQSIYGGGESCGTGSITVEKQVLNPATTNTFVDNLSLNDPAYKPGAPIAFKVIVKNTSNKAISNIIVSDNIDNSHEFVNFVSVNQNIPFNWNNSTKTLTYSISSLGVGQENDVTISGDTVLLANLPTNRSIVCPSNTVAVTANNTITEATSEFCIQKPTNGTNVTNTTTTNQTSGNNATQITSMQPVGQNTNQTTTTTKGGIPLNQIANQPNNFPVYTPVANTTKTPSTGPEELPLLAMIPTGGLGWWLKKKARMK